MGKKLIQQRRGRVKGRYNVPSHRFRGDIRYQYNILGKKGVVEDIIHDPGRTAPLAVIKLEDKTKTLMIAAEGTKVGDEIKFTEDIEAMKPGNVLPVGKISEGYPIYNIELKPGDGGKLVRAGGSSATVVSHSGNTTTIRLPSGRFKTIPSNCLATIGAVAGGGRKDKPFMKAGKKFHAARAKGRIYPVVRGAAMNPVAHPHGGGAHQHVGKPYTVRRGEPPGRKVGSIAARRTGRK